MNQLQLNWLFSTNCFGSNLTKFNNSLTFDLVHLILFHFSYCYCFCSFVILVWFRSFFFILSFFHIEKYHFKFRFIMILVCWQNEKLFTFFNHFYCFISVKLVYCSWDSFQCRKIVVSLKWIVEFYWGLGAVFYGDIKSKNIY